MKLSALAGITALFITALCMTGCNSKPEPKKIDPNDVFKQMQEDFKRMKDPKSAIDMMRQYAQEKLPRATDEELQFLEGTPIIKKNFDGTMYAYFWKRAYGKGIQVLSTPPPCKPIEVYRTRRVRFP